MPHLQYPKLEKKFYQQNFNVIAKIIKRKILEEKRVKKKEIRIIIKQDVFLLISIIREFHLYDRRFINKIRDTCCRFVILIFFASLFSCEIFLFSKIYVRKGLSFYITGLLCTNLKFLYLYTRWSSGNCIDRLWKNKSACKTFLKW